MACSILRHRLLDIRLIVRQGVQYAAARGVLLSLVPLLGLILAGDLLVHGDQPLIRILEARGWLYAGVGVVAVAAHSQRRRWGEAVDRRFFRDRYDARRLLREVAAESEDDRQLLAAIAANLETLLDRPPGPPARPEEGFEECPVCGACYDTETRTCGQDGSKLASVHTPRLFAGRYRLERRLGSGGMGAVYEATDRALRRRVALKVIREDRLERPGAAQRFEREARAAAAFSHPTS